LGASPQTPRVGFAEVWGWSIFCEAELRFLLLFLEKEDNIRLIVYLKYGLYFCEAEQTLFASFSGKRRYY
jgi:hypothetical protein